MCTVVTLLRPGHDWPLLLAANRDEMAGRPWKAPARHWPDRAEVVAGLDELAGGTWMGMNDWGVVAAVLNRKGTLGPMSGFRSRGELPLEALDHAEAGAAAEALADLDPAAYRAFNMVIADRREGYWLASRGDGRVTVAPLAEGITLLTAFDANDTEASGRARFYLPRFREASVPDPDAGNWEAWAALMASRTHLPDAGPDGALCVEMDSGFGTTSSSLVALPSAEFPERRAVWKFAPGKPDRAAYRDVEF